MLYRQKIQEKLRSDLGDTLKECLRRRVSICDLASCGSSTGIDVVFNSVQELFEDCEGLAKKALETVSKTWKISWDANEEVK